MEKSGMEIEMKRIQDSLVIVSKEKEAYRHQSENLNWRLNDMENVEKINTEYENKLALLSGELKRLNKLLQDRN